MNKHTTKNCPCCETPMRDELQESWRTKTNYHLYTCDNPDCEVRGLTLDDSMVQETKENPEKLEKYKGRGRA